MTNLITHQYLHFRIEIHYNERKKMALNGCLKINNIGIVALNLSRLIPKLENN